MSAAAGAAVVGFCTGLSLILAIGAQNAFVLRQGLAQAHVLPLCLFCAVSDAALIAAGVAGFGALGDRFPALPALITLGGAVFLLAYGALRFRAAWHGGQHLASAKGAGTLAATLGTAAALTWLNPHVYLDTLALIGAVSTRFDGAARMAFAAGAMAASFVFFFGLGYGARLLAPVMHSDRSWQVLDIGIGALMWGLAAGLIAAAPALG